jgi:DNA-directed RNA polymerase specialized sigma24 family protein
LISNDGINLLFANQVCFRSPCFDEYRRSLPTRASLLKSLADPDSVRWEEFHETYRGLILGVGRRSGLNDHEAKEALQDVLLTVSQKLPDFQYDPTKDSFKGWLLQITR